MRKELFDVMKNNGLNRFDFDDGTYIRRWDSKMNENVALFGSKDEPAE